MQPWKRLLVVFGTRPEAIKMAPLCHALGRETECFEILICVTGQHRQMLDQVLQVFQLRPDIDLHIMQPAQDLFDVTANGLLNMRKVLQEHAPDLILVHGDTATTLVAALAGFYLGIDVAHVEAGLRTHDINSPFPEEFNRQTVSKLARWHFAPTTSNQNNLLAEGVPEENILVTGNTVIDAMHLALNNIESDPISQQKVSHLLNSRLGFEWQRECFILVTGHRRENFGEGMRNICAALNQLAELYPDVHFIYPVHLNPHIREVVFTSLAQQSNIHLLEPLDYPDFLMLLKYAFLVLTDSGGVQEEAPSLNKPVLLMREVTERPEAIATGSVKLVGARQDQIVEGTRMLLDNPAVHDAMTKAPNPYGDGLACQRIIEFLKQKLYAPLA